ncbi:MAG TPA: DUF6691 family protein [Candidatus Binataceae bacterium]|nr:DUF6691 family protein [Candidatus Binataceae bacterium]
MKALLVSFFSGIVFALGLGISGMTRPIKVIGFLDFTGKWDASLAFVMLGAIAVYSIAYRLVRGRRAPLLGERFLIPERMDIDRNLIAGAAMFGAGWGLAGFCPGPAITSLASGAAPVALFVIAMVAGIYLHGAFTRLAEIRMRPVSAAAQIAADS